MKTWRLALVRADGGAVDARTAVVRYVAAWIGPAASLVAYAALQPANLGAHAAWLVAIGYLWPLVDPDRQFLHDRIAGTRIVMASPDPLHLRAPARHAHADQHHAGDGERIERLAEQQPRHDAPSPAGTRKNSPATFDAAPWRSSQ